MVLLNLSWVSIDMKLLGADSFIIGTRRLLQMFPIKQKCHTTAPFLDNQNYSIWSNLEYFFTNVQQAWYANKLHNGLSKKMTSFKHFNYEKKLL